VKKQVSYATFPPREVRLLHASMGTDCPQWGLGEKATNSHQEKFLQEVLKPGTEEMRVWEGPQCQAAMRLKELPQDVPRSVCDRSAD
jgi:hypothetical protein